MNFYSRGQGKGQGMGRGSQYSGGRGYGEGRGLGSGGMCICPSCNYEVPHTAGTPCSQMQCPKCGAPMIRK